MLDVTLACFQRVDFALIGIVTDDDEPRVDKGPDQREADVAQPNYTDLAGLLFDIGKQLAMHEIHF